MSDDQYKRLAAKMFGVPLDQVTPEQRRVAKARYFSAAYGVTGRIRSGPALQNIPVRTPEGAAVRDAFIKPRQKLERMMREHPDARLVTDVGASMFSGWGDLRDVRWIEDFNALELTFD